MKPFHKMKKKPLHAEDVAEELRKRVQFGRLTFRESEILRLASILDKLSYRCAEAYQVVGQLADAADYHEDRSVVKAMDLLSQPLRRGDILRFVPPSARAKFGMKAEALFNAANKGPSAKPVRKKVRR